MRKSSGYGWPEYIKPRKARSEINRKESDVCHRLREEEEGVEMY